MQPEQSKALKRPVGAERAFPWRCRHCGQKQVFMAQISYEVDEVQRGFVGQVLSWFAVAAHLVRPRRSFTIPALEIPICRACGEKVFTERVDEQIQSARNAQRDTLSSSGQQTA